MVVIREMMFVIYFLCDVGITEPFDFRCVVCTEKKRTVALDFLDTDTVCVQIYWYFVNTARTRLVHESCFEESCLPVERSLSTIILLQLAAVPRIAS